MWLLKYGMIIMENIIYLLILYLILTIFIELKLLKIKKKQ